MRTLPLLFSTLGVAALANAQDLRRGLIDADVVIVGRQVGKKPFGEDLAMHRVQVLDDIRGADGNAAVTVLDWPKLSLHNRPTPRQSRLFCLQDASAIAERLGLPSNNGPYYKLLGWAGSHPLVGKDLDKDPTVQFARVLAAGEAGASSTDTANALAAIAIEPDGEMRTQAVRLLSERGDLRGRLSSIHWNQLIARATGEVDDIDYKIALAELCCEQRLEGLLDALAISLGQVTDVEFARCVGRVGKVLHGEQATEKLNSRLRLAGQDEDRRMLLLAIGATNTESGLQTLLSMNTKDAAVRGALQEHRSPRAKQALEEKK